MKKFAIGTIELLLTLFVDHFARLSGFIIEPVSDIGTCGLDDGLD
jgi:hypothetical protein